MAANTMKNEGNGAGMIASVANLGSDAYEGIEEFNGQRRWIFIGLSVADIGLILKSANGLLTVLTSECMTNSKFLAQALGFLEGRVALRIISIVTSWELYISLKAFWPYLSITLYKNGVVEAFLVTIQMKFLKALQLFLHKKYATRSMVNNLIL
ncbi:hypothetical protein LZ667_18950 [Hafnia alvei]|uniref:hypothetical protein n=1 Tax=Hafnia alvei TaxID=569 RepID=UPI001F2C0873|nr:hypothetical protein [Hafnia alvei]MCE9873452.1 hypothetical protein [Hafnia alvei]